MGIIEERLAVAEERSALQHTAEWGKYDGRSSFEVEKMY